MTTTLDLIAPATQPSLEALRSAWLFSDCAGLELERVHALCRPVAARAGVTVVCERAERQPSFVVVNGTAAVERTGHRIGHAAAGAIIGVGELLDQRVSTVTIVAVTDMLLLQLDITELRALLGDGFGWSIRHRLEVMTAENQRRTTASVLAHSSYL
jgi:CRP-like cAMP-binding protein